MRPIAPIGLWPSRAQGERNSSGRARAGRRLVERTSRATGSGSGRADRLYLEPGLKRENPRRPAGLLLAATDFRGTVLGVVGVLESRDVDGHVVVAKDEWILPLPLVEGKERLGVHARLEAAAQELVDYLLRGGDRLLHRVELANAPHL